MNLLNTEYVADCPVEQIGRHPSNPRQGDTGAIYTSIEANGFYGACIVQRSTGWILAGNHRYDAALHHGAAAVPVIYIECDDATAIRILLADNRSSDLAAYDLAALQELLQQVLQEQGSLLGTCFDQEALTRIGRDMEGYHQEATAETASLPATEASNEPRSASTSKESVPESPADQAVVDAVDKRDELVAKWRTGPGQLWIISSLKSPGLQHRLFCGDSRKAEDLDALLAGELVEWVWTDPPYGISYVGKTDAGMEIENDGAEDLDALLAGVFAQCLRVMEPGAPIYVAHPHGPMSLVFAREFAARFHWHQTIIWLKNSMVMGHSDYHYRHEPILYGWKENPKAKVWEGGMDPSHPWHGERNKTTVLAFDRPSRSDLHPTTKPTGLIAHCIENSSRPGARGFEPFAGSGTTILAAEETGRVCSGIELDPKYAAVCLERFSLAGMSPELAG